MVCSAPAFSNAVTGAAPDASARRRRWPAARAFTVLEVMLAATILVLAIAGALTTLQRGFIAIDNARNYTYASQILQSELERLRLYNWSQLSDLQASGNTSFVGAAVASTASATFTCTRTIADVKTDMKEITVQASWTGHDGRHHTAQLITHYGRRGMYDYIYTTH
jgi:Tfp pilus assembly protein PilV